MVERLDEEEVLASTLGRGMRETVEKMNEIIDILNERLKEAVRKELEDE